MAIKRLHGCESHFIESVSVKETFKSQVVWDGTVEIFALTGHPKAQRCYAWSYFEDDKEQFVTVLHIDPVNSPQKAVQAAITSQP